MCHLVFIYKGVASLVDKLYSRLELWFFNKISERKGYSMGYCFSRKYLSDATAMIVSIDIEMIQLDYNNPRRIDLERTKKILRRFMRYHQDITKKIISLQYDAYLIGESFGSLADEEFAGVFLKIYLGQTENEMDLFRRLEEIDSSLFEVSFGVLQKSAQDEEKRKLMLERIEKENELKDKNK